VAADGKVVVAPMMRVALTFDHRVIDGAEAADVLTDLKQHMEQFGCVHDLGQFRPRAERA
jgi:pyruvate/2-oxoglutarate dehydrogenase complex dihydrolipoamide acyltransferase (E2) component